MISSWVWAEKDEKGSEDCGQYIIKAHLASSMTFLKNLTSLQKHVNNILFLSRIYFSCIGVCAKNVSF